MGSDDSDHVTLYHTTLNLNTFFFISIKKSLRNCLLIALSLLTLTGCESPGYYTQATLGHWQLYRGRQPVSQALTDDRLNPTERSRLALSPEVLAFAQTHLNLPSDGQYETLVFMQRNAVTYNVFAAPQDSLTPKTWCFPVAGCVSYRGYFTLEKAKAYAKKLSTKGWETYVGGAAAYSTLGWFEDPILSTFLKRETPEFIGLLFHELAHQQLYVKNDTTFNESFATAVEQAGVSAWYTTHPNDEELVNYLNRFERRTAFLQLAMTTKNQLKLLYDSTTSDENRIAKRKGILTQFRQQYENLVETQWQGQRPYGGWMKGPLNNAQWNTLSAYYDLVPAFTHLLNHLEGNFQQFYDICAKLGKKPKAERRTLLEQCSQAHCPIATDLATG